MSQVFREMGHPFRFSFARLALALSLLMAALTEAASAQTVASPRPTSPPATAPAAVASPSAVTMLSGLPGYRFPEVAAGNCRIVNAGRRDCLIPAMTAGRYVIRASGTSMPVGAKPRQQLTIIVANRNCAQTIDYTSWTGGSRTIRAICDVTILSDTPVLVSVVYADIQALKVASGPEVVFERVRWDGVLQMRDASPKP